MAMLPPEVAMGRIVDSGWAVTAEQRVEVEALEAAVETPPPSLGLPFDVWTSARLSAYLAGTTAVRIAPGWLRALLARRDFVCGRPKHTLKHLQDPEEVAACKAALAGAGGKGGGRTGPVRIPFGG